ncbi:MAG: hypothetical protein ACE5PT_04025 [Gemmatimonadales bacterium]
MFSGDMPDEHRSISRMSVAVATHVRTARQRTALLGAVGPLVTFALFCSTFPTGAADAQQSSATLRPELDAVPVVGELSLPGETSAALEPGDYLLPHRATYARAWTVSGTAGRTYTIDAVTDQPEAFDPFLYVVGPGLARPLENDDGGGECNARIRLTFPETGTYRIVVTTWREWETGGFTLRATERTEPGPDWGCNDFPEVDDNDVFDVPVSEAIAIGAEVEGALTDEDREDFQGRRQKGFALAGRAGATVTIELSSAAFWPALVITGPQLNEQLHDDGDEETEEGRLARISVTFPKNGTYKVVATSSFGPPTGPFTLRVRGDQSGEPASVGTDLWLIAPGERVGPVERGTSEDALSSRVGSGNLAHEDIALGEGETEPGTVVFPDDSLLRLEILWEHPEVNVAPREIRLGGSASLWRTVHGITLGTSLRELEKLNGGPFTLAGWGWDYGGSVYHWNGGVLDDELPGVFLRLDSGRWDRLSGEEASQLDGDEGRSSALPAMQRLNPVVVEIRVTFEP